MDLTRGTAAGERKRAEMRSPHPRSRAPSAPPPLDVKDLLVNRIAELFGDRGHADVVLVAPSDGREFYVHRGIVAGWSPVLRRLFEEEFRFLSSGGGTVRDMSQIQRVELPFEGSSSALNELLQFCYTGSVELESAAQTMELLAAASIYEVHSLAHECRLQLDPKLGKAEVERLLQREKERISGFSAGSGGGTVPMPERGDILEALHVQEVRKSQHPDSPVVGHLTPKDSFEVERAVEIEDVRGGPRWRIKTARGWVDMFEHGSSQHPFSRSHGTALEFRGQHFYKRCLLAPHERSNRSAGKSMILTKAHDGLYDVMFETVWVLLTSELQKIVREMLYRTSAPVTEVFGLPCTAIQDHDHSIDGGGISFRAGDTVVVTDRTPPDWWKGTVNGRATGEFPRHKVELDVDFAQKQSQSDVTVVLQDEDSGPVKSAKEVFLVHRAILSIWSDTFEEEFADDMHESRRKADHTFTLNLPHYGHREEMHDLLNFFYTGELAVTAQNAPAILHLGMLYGVNELLIRHCKRLLQDVGDSTTYQSLKKQTEQLRAEDIARHVSTMNTGQEEEPEEKAHRRHEQRLDEVPIAPGCSALAYVKERLGASEGSIISRKLMEEAVHTLYPMLNLRREVDLVCDMLDPSTGIALLVEKLDVAIKYLLYFRTMRPIFQEIEDHIPDSRLALSEFEQACHHVGEVMTSDEMRQAFHDLDEEHNDVVEIDEFCEWACQRNVHPIEAVDVSTRTKQRLRMPEPDVWRKALSQVGVPTDDTALSTTAVTEAVGKIFPGLSLSAECLRAFRAVQVRNSRAYALLCDGQGHDIEYEQARVGAHGESPFHAHPSQEVLGVDFSRILKYVIWLHDHWPKLQIVLMQIADREDHTMTVAEFSRACILMNVHLADEEMLRNEFGMLERIAPYPRGFASADDFVNWLLLTHPIEDEVTKGQLTLEVAEDQVTLRDSSPRSPRPVKHTHIASPRYGGEHDLTMPLEETTIALFERYDPNGHGLTKTDVGHALQEVFPRISLDHHPAIFRAFEAADDSEDGWIGCEQFKLLTKYFIYFYREHSKLEAIRSEIKPDVSGVRYIDIRCPKSKSDHKCSCKGTKRCQLFWLKAACMDIQLTGATVSTKYKEAAGTEITGGDRRIAKLTFANFCTWVVRTKCGPSYDKEVKRNRQDGHFVVDVDEAHKRTGRMLHQKAFDIPVPDHCEEIWKQVGVPGGTLGIEDVATAVRYAWPEFKDTGLAMARAMRATGMDHHGHIAERQFRELLKHLNFFITKAHVLREADRGSTGKMTEAGFKRACCNLHFHLAGAEIEEEFDKLKTTYQERASNATMLASRPIEQEYHSVMYEDFCVWAAAEHMGKHKSRRQGSQCEVPPLRSKSRTSTSDVFQKLDAGAGYLSLAGVTQGVEMIWPHLQVPRSMILRAYNACQVHGDGNVGLAEFHMCLQWISYLDYAWEVLESLHLNDARRRIDVDLMIHACNSLDEWLEADEISKIFQELAQGGDTISFDQFCNWLLGRHVEPPTADSDDELDPTEKYRYMIPHNVHHPPVSRVGRVRLAGVPEDVPPAVEIALPQPEECRTWFDEWDDDRNGFLSLAEIRTKILDKFPDLREQVIRRAYRAADYSGNGYVGRQEFNKFLRFLEFFNNSWDLFQAIEHTVEHPSRLTLTDFKRAASKFGILLDSSSSRRRNALDAAAELKAMRTFRNGRILMVDFCTWVVRKKCGDDRTWRDTTKYAHMRPKEVLRLGKLYKTGEGVDKNLQEAYICFKSAAHRGSVAARRELADCYLRGIGVDKDVTHGLSHLMQAADMGDHAAQCRLGLAYMTGDGVPKDLKQAYKQFLAGAHANNAKCQFNLGLCFANGHGVPRDESMAFQYYMQAAHQELPEAQNNVGECYITGSGVEQNVREGILWKKKASHLGLAEAQFNLGLTYLHGHFGVEQNMGKAMMYLKLADEQKHPEARKIIIEVKQREAQKEKEAGYVRRLREYFEIEEDKITLKATLTGELRKTAIDHVQAAADEGLTEAQWHLGRLIEDGHVYRMRGKPNLKRAAAEYANAAQAKHIGSLYRLGELLMHFGWEQGQLELHWAEAVRNFTKAANSGHVEAMYSLGEAWMARAFSGDDEDSEGHALDQGAAERALAWFVKAAEAGEQRAQFNLGLLYQDGGQVVARSLHRSIYYYRMAARHSHAVHAKMNLAWVLLKYHRPESTTATAGQPQSISSKYRFGHRSSNDKTQDQSVNGASDTAAEAKVLMSEAHAEGHQQASLALEHWDEIVDLIQGPGSILDRMDVFMSQEPNETVHRMMQMLMVKEIEHQEALDDVLKLKRDLDEKRVERQKQEDAVATLKEEKDFKEARNGRLLMISSCAWHPRRLLAAGSERSTCFELQWAATEAVPQEDSLDHVLGQAHRAMSRENLTGRYKSAALWTVPVKDVRGSATGFKLTEGHDVTLFNVQRDEGCRDFWRGMANMIDEDGYFVLFGLGNGDDSEEWHEMLKELSIVMNRGVINVDISAEHDVQDDGTLSKELVSNHDFRDFFDIDFAQDWARATAPDLEEERRVMEPYHQGHVSAEQQRRRAEDKVVADEARHRDDLEKERRADYRVDAEIERMKRQRDRAGHISPRTRRGRFVPREVQALHEVQTFLHNSDIDEVQLMFGIDFAGSNEWNGSRTYGGRSLHALDAGVPTPYEAVMQSICNTMDVFADTDATIPCYGFGDHRVTGSKESDARAAKQHSVFSLKPGDQPCGDVDEIISLYRAVKQAVALGTPQVDKRCFAPIINKAIELLNEKRDTPRKFDKFHVLVILTDGQVHRDSRVPPDEWSPEEMETVLAIQKASHLPLSIVVIGVGDGTGEHVSDDDGRMVESGCWKSLHHMAHGIHHREFENFVFTEYGRHSNADTSHQVKIAQLVAHAVRQLPSQWRVIRKKAISDPLGPHEKTFELSRAHSHDSDEESSDSDDEKEEWDIDDSKKDKVYVSYVKTRPPPSVPQVQDSKSLLSRSPREKSNHAQFMTQIRREFERLGVGRDQVLARDEVKTVVEDLRVFSGERFSDWHFEQFCDLSNIDPHTSSLHFEDLENYCCYMNSRCWAEKAFCVYDRSTPTGWLNEAELCLLCRNELKAFHKPLGRRLPSVHWTADTWANFWQTYAGVEPHTVGATEELPRCTWEVFAKFVHHMRHVARMVAYTKTFKHQLSRLTRSGTTPSSRVRDPQGEALWEIEFDREWEAKLNMRRRKIGPNPVPHPDYKHLLEVPQRDVGAETTDEDDDVELHPGLNYGPEPEPEPVQETRRVRSESRAGAATRGSTQAPGFSSDDDDIF